MPRITLILMATFILSGCWGVDREALGIQRCTPKSGFESYFSTFEYDANDAETRFTTNLLFEQQTITFRDRVSGNLMTVGKDLAKYYTCQKIG